MTHRDMAYFDESFRDIGFDEFIKVMDDYQLEGLVTSAEGEEVGTGTLVYTLTDSTKVYRRTWVSGHPTADPVKVGIWVEGDDPERVKSRSNDLTSRLQQKGISPSVYIKEGKDIPEARPNSGGMIS